MSGDAENARIWEDALVSVGETDATPPTDTVTALGADWDDLGLLSDDGGSMSSDETVSDKYSWGGKLVRTVRSKHKKTLKVTALEDNPVVWGLVNPGSTAESAGGVTTRTVVTPRSNPKSFVLELFDGDIVKRRWIPRGEVVSSSDEQFKDDEITSFALSINIYPTTVDDEDDVLYIEITDDPQAEAGS